MNYKFFLLHIALSLNSITPAMQDQEKPVKTVSDIGGYCAKLIEQVSQQPFFQGDGKIAENLKILFLENNHDGALCEIISDNARKVLQEQKAWIIHSFGTGGFKLCSTTRKSLGSGIAFQATELTSSLIPSLETLKYSHDKIIKMLQDDWNPASLENNPDIFCKKNPEQWNLFIKNSTLYNEDLFICFLATKFGFIIDTTVSCHNIWKSEHGYEYQNKIYLWVKKDKQGEFDKIFEFQYTSSN